MDTKATAPNQLGRFLVDRRARLDPVAFGFSTTRRRTPGLRREEVAGRANISTTWYTWLEQGRGGAPSASVLDQVSKALMLTDVEREHLFILGIGRPPEIRPQIAEGITPRLQSVLDAFEICPAFIKTTNWDVVAWNRAAAQVFTDFGKIPMKERNILRLMFLNSHSHASQLEWEQNARFVVAAFRADTARTGDKERAEELIVELNNLSPEFAEMWQTTDVRNYDDGVKQILHSKVGTISLEFSAFSVDGRPDLGMIVYSPVSEDDSNMVRSLLC